MNQIVLCTAFDKNYQNWAAVSLRSILNNSRCESQIRLIIISDLTYEKCIVQLRRILDSFDFTIINSGNEFEGLPKLNHVGLVTYWRLKLPEVLTKYNIKKAIYFDVDTLILGDISELFNHSLKNMYCGGCLDINSEQHVRRMKLVQNFVINGGLLLLDVVKMNSINWVEGVKHLNEQGKITWVDQDAINILLDGKIQLLPQSWNVQSGNFQNGYTGKVDIAHFTESGKTKPWSSKCRHPFFSTYRTYMRISGFLLIYLKLEIIAKLRKSKIIN
jgi:UDP-glucose:(galactosyl)LPS alpha-1,2-glucosyltransferase